MMVIWQRQGRDAPPHCCYHSTWATTVWHTLASSLQGLGFLPPGLLWGQIWADVGTKGKGYPPWPGPPNHLQRYRSLLGGILGSRPLSEPRYSFFFLNTTCKWFQKQVTIQATILYIFTELYDNVFISSNVSSTRIVIIAKINMQYLWMISGEHGPFQQPWITRRGVYSLLWSPMMGFGDGVPTGVQD